MVRDRYPTCATRRGRAALGLTLAALLAGAGCAQVDGAALPLADPGLAATGGEAPLRYDYRVVSENGESVALSEWRAKGETKAVMLAVHGFGDYGPSTFGRAASAWAGRGLTVYAYDQRGFGRNPSNGVWPGHDALVDDLARVTELVRARHPGVPLVLAGHSMGGAVVAAALGSGRVSVERAVLLAPALWGGPHLNPAYRIMAFAAAAVAPDKRWTGEGVVKIQASDNIAMLRALGRDPLFVRNPSSREFVGLIRIMDRAYEALPAIRIPALVVYGAKDEVVPEDPVRAGFERISGPKRYERVETGWHMLLRDLKAETVWDLVADFALEPTGT